MGGAEISGIQSRIKAINDELDEMDIQSSKRVSQLDNFEKADGTLKTIQEGNSAYNNRATWYLALSKLKQEKEEACIILLKTIPEDADDYSQALKLLNKLD